MPCGSFRSELQDKLGVEERDKMHRQKTEVEKQIVITNSIWVAGVPLMSGMICCAHVFQGQTLIPGKFNLSHCFYCKTLILLKLYVTVCKIIIVSSVLVLP